jgi:hypothetical protein
MPIGFFLINFIVTFFQMLFWHIDDRFIQDCRLLLRGCGRIDILCGWQGRIYIIIGSRSKQCTGVPTYTTTRRNKNINGR